MIISMSRTETWSREMEVTCPRSFKTASTFWKALISPQSCKVYYLSFRSPTHTPPDKTALCLLISHCKLIWVLSSSILFLQIGLEILLLVFAKHVAVLTFTLTPWKSLKRYYLQSVTGIGDQIFLATRKGSNYKDCILSEYCKTLRFWCRPPNCVFHTRLYYKHIWNPSLSFTQTYFLSTWSVKEAFLQTMPYLVLDVLENFSYSL